MWSFGAVEMYVDGTRLRGHLTFKYGALIVGHVGHYRAQLYGFWTRLALRLSPVEVDPTLNMVSLQNTVKQRESSSNSQQIHMSGTC